MNCNGPELTIEAIYRVAVKVTLAGLDTVARPAVRHSQRSVQTVSSGSVRDQIAVAREARVLALTALWRAIARNASSQGVVVGRPSPRRGISGTLHC